MHTTHVLTTGLHTQIAEGMSEISNILLKSYGPLGGASILSNGGFTSPVVTKDGKTILDALKFHETPLKQDVLMHIRSIANKLVKEVGDGSTSSVVVATEIFKQLLPLRETYTNGKKFEKDVMAVHNAITRTVDTYLTRQLPEDKASRISLLAQLAAVSNNNDKDLGVSVAEIMVNHANEHTVVNVVNAVANNAERVTFSAKSGFDASHAKIQDTMLLNMFKTSVVTIENPLIVTAKELLTVHFNHIITAIKDAKRPCFIFAETVQQEVLAAITRDTMIATGNKQIPLITLFNANSTTNSDLAYRRSLDFEIFTGSDSARLEASVSNSPESVVEDDSRWYIGGAESISIDKSTGTAVISKGDGVCGSELKVERFQDYLNTLERDLDELSSDMRIQRGVLLGSINRLKAQSLTLFVGGHTEDEKQTTKALIEDSVLACQSAMKSGYTIGANLAVLYALYIVTATEFNSSEPTLSLAQINIANKMIDAYERVRDIPFTVQGMDTNLKPNYDDWNRYGVWSTPGKGSNSLPAFVILNTNEEVLEGYLPNDTVSSLPIELPETNIFAATNTDKAILSASLSIVTLLLNSNQFLSN